MQNSLKVRWYLCIVTPLQKNLGNCSFAPFYGANFVNATFKSYESEEVLPPTIYL